jgi:hypothetical protein
MKKTILALVALSAAVFLAGCDPFGSTETMTYITGTIYADTAKTEPAEGIAVELLVNPDSSAVRTQTVFTNAAGVFFIEAQFYPSLPDAEAGTGYSMPSTTNVGLEAHHGADSYVYASVDEGFVLAAGDTLVVWPVDLSSFGGSGGETR